MEGQEIGASTPWTIPFEWYIRLIAGVAQLVEQRFRKAWVACSSQVIGFEFQQEEWGRHR